MPVSQGSAGGLPGMNLKAWALVNTTTGTVLKGQNVTSVNTSGVLSFAVAMTSANYVVRVIPMISTMLCAGIGAPVSASQATAQMRRLVDESVIQGLMFVEIYE